MSLAGGCHCGRVRFRVAVAELAEVQSPEIELLDCNCSVCTMKGFLHLIVDEARFACDDTSAMTRYSFGTHVAQHMFCATCGVQPFYRPRSHPNAWDVNARCLDGFDQLAKRIVPFDGRNWEQSALALRSQPARIHLELVTIVVDDYDPAIRFFVEVLGFTLVEDLPATTTDNRAKRWVVVRPPGAITGILLARAVGDEQAAAVGHQVGGRVGFFLRTADFDAAQARLLAAGVEIVRPPHAEPYGRVLVFRDVAGNRWDLLGPPA